MNEVFNDDPAAYIARLIVAESSSDQPEQNMVAISSRITSDRLVVIDSLAKMASLSRNAMVNLLLKAGCYDVMSRLPESFVSELAQETEGKL